MNRRRGGSRIFELASAFTSSPTRSPSGQFSADSPFPSSFPSSSLSSSSPLGVVTAVSRRAYHHNHHHQLEHRRGETESGAKGKEEDVHSTRYHRQQHHSPREHQHSGDWQQHRPHHRALEINNTSDSNTHSQQGWGRGKERGGGGRIAHRHAQAHLTARANNSSSKKHRHRQRSDFSEGGGRHDHQHDGPQQARHERSKAGEDDVCNNNNILSLESKDSVHVNDGNENEKRRSDDSTAVHAMMPVTLRVDFANPRSPLPKKGMKGRNKGDDAGNALLAPSSSLAASPSPSLRALSKSQTYLETLVTDLVQLKAAIRQKREEAPISVSSVNGENVSGKGHHNVNDDNGERHDNVSALSASHGSTNLSSSTSLVAFLQRQQAVAAAHYQNIEAYAAMRSSRSDAVVHLGNSRRREGGDEEGSVGVSNSGRDDHHHYHQKTLRLPNFVSTAKKQSRQFSEDDQRQCQIEGAVALFSSLFMPSNVQRHLERRQMHFPSSSSLASPQQDFTLNPPTTRLVRQLGEMSDAVLNAALEKLLFTSSSSASFYPNEGISTGDNRGRDLLHRRRRAIAIALGGLKDFIVDLPIVNTTSSSSTSSSSSAADRLLAILFTHSAALERQQQDDIVSLGENKRENNFWTEEVSTVTVVRSDEQHRSEKMVSEEDHNAQEDDLDEADDDEDQQQSDHHKHHLGTSVAPFFLPFSSASLSIPPQEGDGELSSSSSLLPSPLFLQVSHFAHRPLLKAAMVRHYASVGDWEKVLMTCVIGKRGGDDGDGEIERRRRKQGPPSPPQLSECEKAMVLMGMFVAKTNLQQDESTTTTTTTTATNHPTTTTTAVEMAKDNASNTPTTPITDTKRALNLNISQQWAHITKALSASSAEEKGEQKDNGNPNRIDLGIGRESIIAAFLASPTVHTMNALSLKFILVGLGCPKPLIRRFLTASPKQPCSVGDVVIAITPSPAHSHHNQDGNKDSKGSGAESTTTAAPLSQPALDLTAVLLYRFARDTHRTAMLRHTDYSLVAAALHRLVASIALGCEDTLKTNENGGEEGARKDPSLVFRVPLSPADMAVIAKDVASVIDGVMRLEGNTQLQRPPRSAIDGSSNGSRDVAGIALMAGHIVSVLSTIHQNGGGHHRDEFFNKNGGSRGVAGISPSQWRWVIKSLVPFTSNKDDNTKTVTTANNMKKNGMSLEEVEGAGNSAEKAMALSIHYRHVDALVTLLFTEDSKDNAEMGISFRRKIHGIGSFSSSSEADNSYHDHLTAKALEVLAEEVTSRKALLSPAHMWAMIDCLIDHQVTLLGRDGGENDDADYSFYEQQGVLQKIIGDYSSEMLTSSVGSSIASSPQRQGEVKDMSNDDAPTTTALKRIVALANKLLLLKAASAATSSSSSSSSAATMTSSFSSTLGAVLEACIDLQRVARIVSIGTVTTMNSHETYHHHQRHRVTEALRSLPAAFERLEASFVSLHAAYPSIADAIAPQALLLVAEMKRIASACNNRNNSIKESSGGAASNSSLLLSAPQPPASLDNLLLTKCLASERALPLLLTPVTFSLAPPLSATSKQSTSSTDSINNNGSTADIPSSTTPSNIVKSVPLIAAVLHCGLEQCLASHKWAEGLSLHRTVTRHWRHAHRVAAATSTRSSNNTTVGEKGVAVKTNCSSTSCSISTNSGWQISDYIFDQLMQSHLRQTTVAELYAKVTLISRQAERDKEREEAEGRGEEHKRRPLVKHPKGSFSSPPTSNSSNNTPSSSLQIVQAFRLVTNTKERYTMVVSTLREGIEDGVETLIHLVKTILDAMQEQVTMSPAPRPDDKGGLSPMLLQDVIAAGAEMQQLADDLKPASMRARRGEATINTTTTEEGGAQHQQRASENEGAAAAGASVEVNNTPSATHDVVTASSFDDKTKTTPLVSAVAPHPFKSFSLSSSMPPSFTTATHSSSYASSYGSSSNFSTPTLYEAALKNIASRSHQHHHRHNQQGGEGEEKDATTASSLQAPPPLAPLHVYAKALREDAKPSLDTLFTVARACAREAKLCWAQSLALLKQAALTSRSQHPPPELIAITLKTLIDAEKWDEAATLCLKINRANQHHHHASSLGSGNNNSKGGSCMNSNSSTPLITMVVQSNSNNKYGGPQSMSLAEAVGLSLGRVHAATRADRERAVVLLADVTMKCLVLAKAWDAAVHHFYALIMNGLAISSSTTASSSTSDHRSQRRNGGGGGGDGGATTASIERYFAHPSPSTIEAALEACAYASELAKQSAAHVKCFAGALEDLVCVGEALLDHVIRVISEQTNNNGGGNNNGTFSQQHHHQRRAGEDEMGWFDGDDDDLDSEDTAAAAMTVTDMLLRAAVSGRRRNKSPVASSSNNNLFVRGGSHHDQVFEEPLEIII